MLTDAWTDFRTIPKASNWLNVAGMVCTVSLLISFIVLPVERTSRHYLTVCFIVAVCILQVSLAPMYISVSKLTRGSLDSLSP